MKSKAKKKFAALREKYYLSESGFDSLRSRLQELYNKRAEQLGRMRALKEQQSDNLFIEDSTYIQTVSSIQFLESESQRLESVLANAKLIDNHSKHPPRRVRLGSSVQLETPEGTDRREFTIVDSVEADPFNGKISDDSPLGQQLLGKRLYETIVLNNISKQHKKPLSLKLVSIR